MDRGVGHVAAVDAVDIDAPVDRVEFAMGRTGLVQAVVL